MDGARRKPSRRVMSETPLELRQYGIRDLLQLGHEDSGPSQRIPRTFEMIPGDVPALLQDLRRDVWCEELHFLFRLGEPRNTVENLRIFLENDHQREGRFPLEDIVERILVVILARSEVDDIVHNLEPHAHGPAVCYQGVEGAVRETGENPGHKRSIRRALQS